MVYSERLHAYPVRHNNRSTRNQEYSHTHASSVAVDIKVSVVTLKVQGERDLAKWTR